MEDSNNFFLSSILSRIHITSILYRFTKDALRTLPNPYLSLHNTFMHDSIGFVVLSIKCSKRHFHMKIPYAVIT